ncbi:MAG: TlpA family protein disulfide reductase [Saprospiraceae bacterium]|nr:TlpA family protein disulfide reductase [Candidatus Opimibacter iunctus]
MKFRFPLLSLMAIILTITIPSCTAQPQHPISGVIEIDPAWKSMIYLVQPRHFNEIAADYLGVVIDSAVIETDGSFHFTKVLTLTAEPQLMNLVVQRSSTRFANHLEDPLKGAVNYHHLILQEGITLKLKAKVNAFQYSFNVEHPSGDQRALSALSEVQKNALEEYLAISASDDDNDTLLLEREKNFMAYAGHLMNFADTTSSVYAALIAIRWISPAGDYERMPEFLQRQCSKWINVQPDHTLVEELCAMSRDDIMPVMIRSTIPDYKLPMANGDTILLQNLLGSKLTLLDIWASWCAPCRRENRTILVPLWDQYKDKGLQIVGYSIDSDRDSWQKAIVKDLAAWPQASHLSGDETPFLKSLRITTIPANYLLDAHGKVIAKNVYGEDLRNLVTEYLK